MRIIGIGDNVMDAYLEEGVLYPGGNSVNVPVLARRYGAEAAGYIGIVGNDPPGRHFLSALKEEGLDVSRVRVAEAATACNHIHIDEKGDRHFVGNNGSDVAECLLNLQLVERDTALIESYTLAHTSVHSFIDRLLPAIARRAPLSLDFSDGYHRRNIQKLCPLLRFAFFSGGEKSEEEVHALAAYALDCGARTVVVTRGVRGSYLLEKGRSHTQGIVPAKMVDALGAGDAYIAAFLVHYLDEGEDLAAAAQAASAYAAQNCGQPGVFGHPLATPKV